MHDTSRWWSLGASGAQVHLLGGRDMICGHKEELGGYLPDREILEAQEE